jgi:enoyl-CoA hydratase/carnithine racemase
MEDLVLLEKTRNIAILKINRPKAYNALSKEIVDLIDNKLEIIKKDKEIKVLILTADNHFAAGADIADMVNKMPEEAKAFSFAKTFLKLENLEIPTIAAICGYALGGGLELTLACDLRIASEDAQMGLPEINLGIMPGAGGTVRLPRLIGEARAKEMIFLGSKITASQAYQYGMINKIVKKEDLESEALKMAEDLAQKAPVALQTSKEVVNYGCNQSKEKAFSKESERWAGLFASEDQKEGMSAFLEKRKPQYKGK